MEGRRLLWRRQSRFFALWPSGEAQREVGCLWPQSMLGWGALLLVTRDISVLEGTLGPCVRGSLGDASVARALEQLGLGLHASFLAPSSPRAPVARGSHRFKGLGRVGRGGPQVRVSSVVGVLLVSGWGDSHGEAQWASLWPRFGGAFGQGVQSERPLLSPPENQEGPSVTQLLVFIMLLCKYF